MGRNSLLGVESCCVLLWIKAEFAVFRILTHEFSFIPWVQIKRLTASLHLVLSLFRTSRVLWTSKIGEWNMLSVRRIWLRHLFALNIIKDFLSSRVVIQEILLATPLACSRSSNKLTSSQLQRVCGTIALLFATVCNKVTYYLFHPFWIRRLGMLHIGGVLFCFFFLCCFFFALVAAVLTDLLVWFVCSHRL